MMASDVIDERMEKQKWKKIETTTTVTTSHRRRRQRKKRAAAPIWIAVETVESLSNALCVYNTHCAHIESDMLNVNWVELTWLLFGSVRLSVRSFVYLVFVLCWVHWHLSADRMMMMILLLMLRNYLVYFYGAHAGPENTLVYVPSHHYYRSRFVFIWLNLFQW